MTDWIMLIRNTDEQTISRLRDQLCKTLDTVTMRADTYHHATTPQPPFKERLAPEFLQRQPRRKWKGPQQQ